MRCQPLFFEDGMWKKICTLFFLPLVIFALWGCGMSSASRGTRTLVDGVGRRVQLPEKPSRIVSLTYGTDEILVDLVDSGRIAALCKYAGDEDITFVTKEERDRVGRVVDGEVEGILSLKPDLVLASSSTPLQVVEVLTASGVPVYVSGIPATYEAMKGKVRGVAEAVNEKEKGEALVAEMERRLAVMEEKLRVISADRERTALGLSFRGILGKKGSLFSDVLRLAHVRDGAAVYEIPKGASAYLSLEILPKIDPDVILLPTWRVKTEDDPKKFADGLLENPTFQEIKAIKNGRLIPFPEKYKYVMSHHVVDAIEAAARAVYPEVIGEPLAFQ